MLTGKEIRQQFIEFFVSKGHTAVKSAPVIPTDDPTLLFTNAGMNQFKQVFLGIKEPAFPRAVDSQKCIRAGGKHNDLEEVGKDGYHHTFFEMLGNWSFADYYKKEAIAWAWELLTEVWALPKTKLYATIHHSDSESGELWKELTDIEPEHVSVHGDKDNFWEMGESGPCGPCSEIHFDRGAEFCEKNAVPGHICAVNGDCSRYIELWNLVFIQYNRDEKGVLNPLPHKYVDTGAGFERICQVLQGQNSNYHTDLFMPILDKIAAISGVTYFDASGMSHRVIADHIRCLSFALADGGFPSNEGRGYVLRRILRRAARHGRLLNLREPFLYKLVDVIIEVMGHHYLELAEKSQYVKTIIKSEEERFNQTLDTGLVKFSEIVSRSDGTSIPGEAAFMLYDTFGFPLDLTCILAEEKGLTVDTAGFAAEMEKQRTRAREASNFKYELTNIEWIDLNKNTETSFGGYETVKCQSYVNRYACTEDGTWLLQVAETPFYAESGGQVADIGVIHNPHFRVSVTDVKKVNDVIIHYGKLDWGMIEASEVTLEIDTVNRDRIARNHTATHILHKALQTLLGEHVQQKGSLVSPDNLRFDFAHFEGLSREQMRDIEKLVNQQIRKNLPVFTDIMPLEQARNAGATALFGEKYGDEVRVVAITDFSKELCGGVHVQATGNIGLFKIISESSSAAGIRRIEAITGDSSEEFVLGLQQQISLVAHKINAQEKKILEKLDTIQQRTMELEKELDSIKQSQAKGKAQAILDLAADFSKGKVIITKTDAESTDAFRKLGDEVKPLLINTAAVLFAVFEDKVSIQVIISADLLAFYHAGKLAGSIAAFVGGKGGGKPDSAMAGGKDIDKLDFAITETRKLFE